MRILVVEDECIVAKDLAATLIAEGHEITGFAVSAEEAIREASKDRPQLALMDIHIRGKVDGIETARILREKFGVAIIYLTAYADKGTVERAKITEPFAYLVKPFNVRELLSSVSIASYKHGIEQQVREREHWFSTTLRSIGDAVIAFDESRRVKFMNTVAEELTGWSSADAVGKTLQDVFRLVPEQSGVAVRDPIAEVLSGEPPRLVSGSGTLLMKNGDKRIIDDIAAPIVDDKKLLGAVLVFRDVTEQRRMQGQLAFADRMTALGTLAGGVAHEITAPLTSSLANIAHARMELSANDAEGSVLTSKRLAEVRSSLGEAYSGADLIRKIVSDLKAFGQLEDDSCQHIDVRACVEWALRMTANEIRGVASVTTEFKEARRVKGSEVRLAQVFVNLLVNARQALEDTEGPKQISLTVAPGGNDTVVVEVRDTGPGIPKDHLEHIFEPFFTTKPHSGGTGLGLAICHGIVRAFGGQLLVESRMGEGTVFRVILPTVAAAAETAAEEALRAQEAQIKGRILVVDDDIFFCKLLERLLRDTHQVVLTTGVTEAVARLEADARYDLILCDLMMPERGGMEFYQEMMTKMPDRMADIVFMTGGAFSQSTVNFLASIPNLRLEKPFTPAYLRAFVQEQLRKRKVRD